MKLRWTRRALSDLQRIADRMAVDKPLDAVKFADAVRNKVSRLEMFPLLGRSSPYPDTREWVVHRNYLVTYRLRDDEIHVLQVWHVARGLPRGARG